MQGNASASSLLFNAAPLTTVLMIMITLYRYLANGIAQIGGYIYEIIPQIIRLPKQKVSGSATINSLPDLVEKCEGKD